MKIKFALSAIALGICASCANAADQAVTPATINKIADEGFNHGQVVDLAEYLSDQIGGRMTNSPSMRKAESWTQSKFAGWGLKNVHAEGYDFGRGWWIESAHTRMITPRVLELRSIPIAWTPGTNGALTAPVVVAPIRKLEDWPNGKANFPEKLC